MTEQQSTESQGRVLALIDRRPTAFLLLFVCVQLVVQIFLLYGHYEFFDVEELKYGQMAKDMLTGKPLLTPFSYATREREGGAHLFHLWVYPFYRLLGPSGFSFKLAALLLMALGSWVWVDLARRIGGAACALAMALLLVLPPPFYLRMSFGPFAVATHMGIVLFTGFSLWFFWRGLVDESLKPWLGAIAAGLFAGLGFYWAMSFAPVLLGVVVLFLLRRKRLRRLPLFLLGALPGLIAWFQIVLKRTVLFDMSKISEWLTHWQWAGGVVEKQTDPVTAGGIADHVWRVLTVHLPRMAGFVDKPSHQFAVASSPASWAYLTLLTLALMLMVFWLRKKDGRRAALLFLPALVYLVVYFISGLDMELATYDQYRYFLPLFPFGFLLIALAVGRLPWRALRVAGIVAVAALGLLSAGNLWHGEYFPTPYLQTRGYDACLWPVSVSYYSQWLTNPLTQAGREDVGTQATLFGYRSAKRAIETQREITPDAGRVMPLMLRDNFWEGAGCYLGFRGTADDGARNVALLEQLPPRRQEALVRGAMTCLDLTYAGMIEGDKLLPQAEAWQNERFPGTLGDDRLREAACNGIGQRAVVEMDYYCQSTMNVETRPECFLDGAARGFALTLTPGRIWPEDQPLPPGLRLLSPEQQKRFRHRIAAESQRRSIINRAYAKKTPLSPEMPPDLL